MFVKIGLDVDAAKFAEAMLAVEGLKEGFHLLGEGLHKAGEILTEAIVGTAEYADSVNKLHEQTGTARDVIQGLAYAGQFADVSMEELGQGLAFLARKGVKDVQGELFKLADKLQTMPHDGSRAQLAMEKFGRAGARMVPLLGQGSEALRKLMDEGKLAGFVMGEDALDGAVAFDDSLKGLKASLLGLRNTIAGPMMAPLAELLDQLRDWVIENRQLIATGLGRFLRALTIVAGALFRALKPIVQGFLAIAANGQALKAVLLGIASIIGGLLLPQIFALTAAEIAWGTAALIAGARAALAAVLPVLPWIALAAVIALVAEDLYQFFTGGESMIGDFIEGVWKQIPYAFNEAWEMVKEGAKAAFAWIADAVKGLGSMIWSGLKAAWEIGIRALPGGDVAADFLFGKGAASPDAIVASSPTAAAPIGAPAAPVVSPQFKANFNVQAAPGQDPSEVAGKVREHMDEWHDTKMRETMAHVGG